MTAIAVVFRQQIEVIIFALTISAIHASVMKQALIIMSVNGSRDKLEIFVGKNFSTISRKNQSNLHTPSIGIERIVLFTSNFQTRNEEKKSGKSKLCFLKLKNTLMANYFASQSVHYKYEFLDPFDPFFNNIKIKIKTMVGRRKYIISFCNLVSKMKH